SPPGGGRPLRRPRRRSRGRRPPGSLARPGDRPSPATGAEADRPDRADALRAGARGRPVVHAGRRRDHDRPLANERRTAADECRHRAARGALPRRRRPAERDPRARGSVRRRRSARRRARHVRARRPRLGRRDAARDRGARRDEPGRAHGPRGEPPLPRPRDARDEDLRTSLRVAELDLHATERDGPTRRAHDLRQGGRTTRVRPGANLSMTTVSLHEKIPNNVDLAGDKRLQRALEQWQPGFLAWWHEMGPEGFQASDVYLRTAVAVDAAGWAHFDYVKMPDYRWGIFLAAPEPGRTIGFGDHLGTPAWQEVPGEYRNPLRRLLVTQGDTEPASVEQQRRLGRTCPSLYDLRN